MKMATALPADIRRRILATTGFTVSCALAFIVMGSAGLIAGLIFSPALLALIVRSKPEHMVPTSNRSEM